MNPLLIVAAGTLLAGTLIEFFTRHRRGDDSMFDCNKDLLKFHNEEVRLPDSVQSKLRDHRAANRSRLKKGLEDNEKPAVKEHIEQGSYPMYTINQHPDNDYDIDDGAAFAKDDLVGAKGAEMTALDTRKMVCDAIGRDNRFNTPPEVRNNCVRVFYNEGHHVDVPVYRACPDPDNDGETFLELASSVGWRRSDPRSITTWFNNAVIDKSPDTTNGRQMRRVVRLLKAFAKSRDSWNMPSGFILSVLVHDHYQVHETRDDVALYNTMRSIHATLESDLTVSHPLLDELLTNGSDDPCMRELRDRLDTALDELQILFDEENCTSKAALKAWNKLFYHGFFIDLIAERADEGLAASTLGCGLSAVDEPSEVVHKGGDGRFG